MSLGPHDLVLAKDKSGNVTAAGFPVSSASVAAGQPALLLRGGGKRGIHLDGLAIPAGLASGPTHGGGRHRVEDAGVAPDALVEQLLLLAAPKKAARPSRRRKTKDRRSRRKTRRTG